jgi:hypothetical protein
VILEPGYRPSRLGNSERKFFPMRLSPTWSSIFRKGNFEKIYPKCGENPVDGHKIFITKSKPKILKMDMVKD